MHEELSKKEGDLN